MESKMSTWRIGGFTPAMDAGTSEGARKAAETRKAHGGEQSPAHQGHHEVLINHGFRHKSSDQRGAYYQHPDRPPHEGVVSRKTGSWRYMSSYPINENSGSGASSLNKHLQRVKGRKH
jgi:hypothetical protein